MTDVDGATINHDTLSRWCISPEAINWEPIIKMQI